MAHFILQWDEEQGYDNSRPMLERAQDTFLLEELRRAEEDDWKHRYQVIHPLSKEILRPLPRAQNRRTGMGDADRTLANDAEDAAISDAARCRIFRTPYKGRVADNPFVDDAKCEGADPAGETPVPFIMRPQTLRTHTDQQRRAGRRLRRYY